MGLLQIMIVADKRTERKGNRDDSYYSDKRERQEQYARQLRDQEQDRKQNSNNIVPERVSLRQQRERRMGRPASPPVSSEGSMMSNIGSHDMHKSSPAYKREQQAKYAQQLAGNEEDYRRAHEHEHDSHRNKPSDDSLDQVLGSINGIHNQVKEASSLNIGSVHTDYEVMNEKRRKQREYQKQLDSQKDIAYSARIDSCKYNCSVDCSSCSLLFNYIVFI